MRVPEALSGVQRLNYFNNSTMTFASFTMLTFSIMIQKQWWVGTLVQIEVVDPNSMNSPCIIHYHALRVKKI